MKNTKAKLRAYNQDGGTLHYYHKYIGTILCLQEAALIGPAKSLTNSMEDVLEDLIISNIWKPPTRVFQYSAEDGVFEVIYSSGPGFIRPYPNHLKLDWKYIGKDLKTLEVLYGNT